MAFLASEKLCEMGFKSLGRGVKLSDKAVIYNADQIEIGDYSRIDDFCVLSGKVKIGRNVHIAVFCNIAGGEQGISMEDFSGLAYGCQVFTQSDDYSGDTLTNPTVPDRFKREIKAAVVIGRHSIVGTGSIVFPGVILGQGTAVGANSVVMKSTEEWCVYFGSPAKRLKRRRSGLLALEAQYLKEDERANES